MRIALGIASTALEVVESRERTEHVWLKRWDDHDQPAGRTNQAKRAPILDEASDERHGASRVYIEQLDQQMQRDIKRINLSLPGDLQLQGMQQLCQNEGQAQLDQHQFGACPPPQVQTQFALEQLEGQFDVPAAGIELRDIAHGQLGRVQHVGQVAILRPLEGKTDQA